MIQLSQSHSRLLVIIVRRLTTRTLVLECDNALVLLAHSPRLVPQLLMKNVQRRLALALLIYMTPMQSMVVPLQGRVIFLHVQTVLRGIVEIARQTILILAGGADARARCTFRNTVLVVETHYSLAWLSHLTQFLSHSPYRVRRCRPGAPRGRVDEKASRQRRPAVLVRTNPRRQSIVRQADETKNQQPRDNVDYSGPDLTSGTKQRLLGSCSSMRFDSFRLAGAAINFSH